MRDALREILPEFLLVFLCGTISWLTEKKEIATVSDKLAVLILLCMIEGSMTSFLGRAESAICQLNSFSRALLPALLSAGGALQIGGETIRYALCMTASDLFISGCRYMIFPLCRCFLIFSAAGTAFDNGFLSGLSRSIQWVCTSLLSGICVLFCSGMGITNLASFSTIRGAKTAKTVLSAAIPVAGSALAEASSSIMGGLKMMRYSVGVFGVAAVLSICFVPFLILGCRFLLFRFLSQVNGAIWENQSSVFLSSVSSVYGILMGTVGAGSVMLLLAIVSMMKAVNGF